MYYKIFVPISFQVYSQFLDSKLTNLLNYCQFCDFEPFRGHFLAILRPFAHFEAKKLNMTYIECLKCIIRCLYQLVFKFSQFLDSKLTNWLNYWQFCDFNPFHVHLLAILRPFAHFEPK